MAWLTGWAKRKKITLTGGASGAQTNFQIKLTVTYDSDMQADFDDIRFTKADGTTLIDAWLESKTDSTSAVVVVEFPTTPANTLTEDYYVYYGNAGVSNVWNGTNTFLFYDDGEGKNDGDSLTTGGWTDTNGTGTEVYEYDNSKSYAGSMSLYGNSLNGGGSPYYAWYQNFTNPAANGSGILEFDMYDNSDNYGATYLSDQSNVDKISLGYYNGHSTTYYTIHYGTSYISLADTTTRSTGWHQFRADVAADGSVEFWVDDDKSTTTAPAGEMDNFGKLLVRDYANSLTWWDRIRVRKFAANPATYGFGSEETEWLSGWSKRKKITLTGGASGAQTNFQLKLTVTYDSDMQADFDDIRFTKADGTTLIDAWLESKTDSTSATVWVEFPTTPANTATEDYYMYYGNSGVSNVWNGDNTFRFFDDFASMDWNKWTQFDGSGSTASGGIVTCYLNGIETQNTFSYPMVIECNAWVYTMSSYAYAYIGVYDIPKCSIRAYRDYQIDFLHASTATSTSVSCSSAANYKMIGSSGNWKLYKNGSQIASATDTIDASSQSIKIYGRGSDGASDHRAGIKADWIFVRNYAANPATYGFGSEESESVVGGMWYYTLLMRRNF